MRQSLIVSLTQYNLNELADFNDWQSKTSRWLKEAAAQVEKIENNQSKEKYFVFPEYAAIELTSLLAEEDKKNLSGQAEKLTEYLNEFKTHLQQLAQKHQTYIIGPSYPVCVDQNKTVNRCFIFTPSGQIQHQDKIFMTRFEDEEWKIQSGEAKIKIFKTPHTQFAICTCFDIEFAAPAVAAAQAGAEIIFVPSCTETAKGMNRVHIGARARALENQCYTVVSQVVGLAPWSPALDMNTGRAAIYAAPDVGFSDDGIELLGEIDRSQIYTQELSLHKLARLRSQGAVFNFLKHREWLKQNQLELFKFEVVELK